MNEVKRQLDGVMGSFDRETKNVKKRVFMKQPVQKRNSKVSIVVVAILFIAMVGAFAYFEFSKERQAAFSLQFDDEYFEVSLMKQHFLSPKLSTEDEAKIFVFNEMLQREADAYYAMKHGIEVSESEIAGKTAQLQEELKTLALQDNDVQFVNKSIYQYFQMTKESYFRLMYEPYIKKIILSEKLIKTEGLAIQYKALTEFKTAYDSEITAFRSKHEIPIITEHKPIEMEEIKDLSFDTMVGDVYAVGYDEEGYIVFNDPGSAVLSILSDHQDIIDLIRSKATSLGPFNVVTFNTYMGFAEWEAQNNSGEYKKSAQQLYEKLMILRNSYRQQYDRFLVPMIEGVSISGHAISNERLQFTAVVRTQEELELLLDSFDVQNDGIIEQKEITPIAFKELDKKDVFYQYYEFTFSVNVANLSEENKAELLQSHPFSISYDRQEGSYSISF